MRTDGIQEEENGMTEEKAHVRSLTEETTSKAVAKSKLRSPAKRPVSNGPQPSDGKLSKKHVQKLNLTRKSITAALATMDEQLMCAVRSTCIAPQLISKLTAAKADLVAELDSITDYVQANCEHDTDKMCGYAKKKLDTTLQSFKILKRMLKYDEPTPMEITEARDPAGDAVCTDAEAV